MVVLGGGLFLMSEVALYLAQRDPGRNPDEGGGGAGRPAKGVSFFEGDRQLNILSRNSQ